MAEETHEKDLEQSVNSQESAMDEDPKTSNKEPRLIIIKIVNENFKSYAGIQELGPFHKSFSSIVGPNGSGKSNVIDAMLFVFGYRSKMIRSKKVSQLIHHSSTNPNVTSCTVSVHFQRIIDLPGDEYEIVAGSNFVVSRTARKDNSSDYYVNGRKMPFKEVAKLLRDVGIDLDHNRFLILQGEVEQISMMKPKALTEHEDGMLEYLEDIIGSSRYKEPIEELTKEVETLNEARGEKLNRVKVVEKEKDELEGTKDEAVEFINMENSITKKRNILFQRYIFECSKNEKKAQDKLDEVKVGFGDLHKQIEECSGHKKTKGKEHKKLSKQHDELAKVAEETKKNFAAYERDDLKLREDYKHDKQNTKKLQKNLDKEKEKLASLKDDPDKQQKKVEELGKKLSDLEVVKNNEEGKLAEIMTGLKHETEGLQNEKESREEELMGKNKVVNETKSKVDVAKSELEIYKSQHKSAMSQLREAHGNLESNLQKHKQRKSEIQNIQKELPELKKNLLKATGDLEKAVEDESNSAQQLRSVRAKVEEARSSLQASRSRGNVLEALMKEKKAGRITGLYGRLGDLGTIDDKYDVAISTACGALDHIVCDTMETAQKCVQFLRKNNIGAATFIGLDKVETWRKEASSTIQTPNNVPRLFDLVRIKEAKVATAFYFALRNTLVAKDLEQSTRIAFQGNKRWRVVTLQGALIDQSGTMSGGGTRVAKGRMCSAFVSDVTPDMLKEMERKLEQEDKAIQESRETKQKLEETVDELKKKTASIDHQLEKNKMEVKALSDQEKILNDQISHLKKEVERTTPDEKRVNELEHTVAKYDKEWKKAAAAASKIEAEVQSLHKQIMDIGGAKLKGQQSRLDAATKAIDEIQGQITKSNVAIKTSKRNIAKCEEKVTSLEKEVEENTANITKLEAEFVTLEEKASQVLDDYEQAQKSMSEMEAMLEKTKQEYAAIEAKENELKNQEVDVKHELDKYETVYKENQQKVKHWQRELSKLALQSVAISDEQQEEGLPKLSDEQLDTTDKESIMYEITVLEEKLSQMKPNMAAIAEYRKKEEAYLARVGELDQVTSDRDGKRREHEGLRKKRLDEFMAGFTIITTKLKEMYQMITLGGDAELELVDSLDPFSEGIVFSVRPPKKSWKNISNLSGGEKTLSSLALVFALHHFKPTPLYVMDEIDAALDFRNVSIVANYIKERTKNAQFIIISLRNNMFELADRLIGIYKTHDCTKSVTINPKLIATQG